MPQVRWAGITALPRGVIRAAGLRPRTLVPGPQTMARDSRSVAVLTAAAGVGVFAGVAGATIAALMNQAKATVRLIEQAAIESAVMDGLIGSDEIPRDVVVAELPVPRADGVYLPDGSLQPEGLEPDPGATGRPLVLAMLGDSTAVGYGTRSPSELPGVLLARGLAAGLHLPVRLSTHGLSGCGAADLPRQLAPGTCRWPRHRGDRGGRQRHPRKGAAPSIGRTPRRRGGSAPGSAHPRRRRHLS